MTMNTKTYNGYKNYETWLVALWIDNDEGSSDMWRECAENMLQESTLVDDLTTHAVTKDEMWKAKKDLASSLESSFDENQPKLEGFWADLLNSALCEVDWFDVAENLLSSVEVGSVEKESV
jgi:hypothetical protein